MRTLNAFPLLSLYPSLLPSLFHFVSLFIYRSSYYLQFENMPLLKPKTVHAIEIRLCKKSRNIHRHTHIFTGFAVNIFALVTLALYGLATKYTYFLSSEADRIRFSMSVCVFLLEHSTTQFYGSAIFIIIMIIPTRKRRQLLETALVPTLSLVVMTMLNIPFASWFFFRFMCVFSFFHCTRKKPFISELTSVCSVQRSTDEYSYRRGNLTTSKHL